MGEIKRIRVNVNDVPKNPCESSAEKMFDQHVLRIKDGEFSPIGPSERLSIILQNYEVGGKHKLHKHDDVEQVYFILKGRARIRVGDEVFEAREGDFIYIPRGVVHSNENIGGGELKVLLISVKVV